MDLDKLLNENAAWLDAALKRPVFDKVDPATLNFPEEHRQRRVAELKQRIDDLSRRQEETMAAYERAKADDMAELKSLEDSRPNAPSTPTMPTPPRGKKRGR
jgi:hypothetical protein